MRPPWTPLVAAWIGWLAVNPKRRLTYGMRAVTPLINHRAGVRDLELRVRGDLLDHPYTLEVVLTSCGRLDIPSSAFDQDNPLCLDVGTPIKELLQTTTTPGHADPDVSVDGTLLRIGPSLIHRRQTTVYSLVVDGPRPTITCPNPPLIDVAVRQEDATTLPATAGEVAMLAGGVAGATAVAVMGQTLAQSLAGAGLAVVLVTLFVMLVVGRRITRDRRP